jgi:transcriptional regulator with XRE-family HTH domain
MEIGKQIKKYRSEMEVSQEELAERIFVSRQTVSNWENDKNYPDLKSLVLLSSLFGVSLDILIKGDIEQMKEEIKSEDINYVKRSDRIRFILLLGTILLTFPVMILWLWVFDFPAIPFPTITGSTTTFLIIMGTTWGILSLLFAVTVFFTRRVSKLMKKFDIKSYKEIVAFYEGKTLSEIDKQRARKEPYPHKKLRFAIYFLIVLDVVFMLFTVGFIFFRIFA